MLVDFTPKNASVGILKAVFDLSTEDKITWQDQNVWNKIGSGEEFQTSQDGGETNETMNVQSNSITNRYISKDNESVDKNYVDDLDENQIITNDEKNIDDQMDY